MDPQSAILDLGNVIAIDMNGANTDPTSAESQLQFQDFSNMTEKSAKYPSRVPPFDQGGEEISQNEDDILISGSDQPDKSKAPPPWGYGIFLQYFNVTSEDVLSRIIWSIMPLKAPTGESYIERFIHNNADIYGPFWISVTLIFSIAIFGNLSSYLTSDEREEAWHNHWDIVGQ